MASRYNGEEIIDNDSSFYRFLRKMRQDQKNIKQYGTQILHNPRAAERMTISKDTYIWSVGDHFYNLAAQYYGDPTYWWVIAWYNGTPTEADIKPGTIVQVPTSLEEALRVLGF